MERNNTKKVSIIIPVYNEKDHILTVLNSVIREMKNAGVDFEIIVVDDGSIDGTAEKIERSGLKIILIRHNINKGYGSALKTGIRSSVYNLIVITDADGTYPNEKIPELLKEIENHDMVVGARIGDNVRIPMIRRPAKWFINKLANYLSGTKVPDLNSGFRIMKKEVIEKFIRILPDGFSFTTTITLAMLSNGFKVKYVPINYFKRTGKSKIKPIKDTLNFIQLVVRTVMYFDPLRVFMPLSLFLLIFAFLVLIGSWLFLGRAMDVTFGVILMTAVIVMTVGMLADLIDKRIQ